MKPLHLEILKQADIHKSLEVETLTQQTEIVVKQSKLYYIFYLKISQFIYLSIYSLFIHLSSISIDFSLFICLYFTNISFCNCFQFSCNAYFQTQKDFNKYPNIISIFLISSCISLSLISLLCESELNKMKVKITSSPLQAGT